MINCQGLPLSYLRAPWPLSSLSRPIRLSTNRIHHCSTHFLHTLTELLQTNDYIHVIALDFSKACDSVRRHSLASKLTNFTLPDHLYNWIVNYLSDRQHQTKLGGSISPTLSINASIIQGSALGPVEYVFSASDLHPISPSSHLCKYADDTYLLVPASNSSSIPLEIQHITHRATANNLKLNNTK